VGNLIVDAFGGGVVGSCKSLATDRVST